jgi:hypothetical protein
MYKVLYYTQQDAKPENTKNTIDRFSIDNNFLDSNAAHSCTLNVTVTHRLVFPVTLLAAASDGEGPSIYGLTFLQGCGHLTPTSYYGHWIQLAFPSAASSRLNRFISQSHATNKVQSWCLGSKLHWGPKP